MKFSTECTTLNRKLFYCCMILLFSSLTAVSCEIKFTENILSNSINTSGFKSISSNLKSNSESNSKGKTRIFDFSGNLISYEKSLNKLILNKDNSKNPLNSSKSLNNLKNSLNYSDNNNNNSSTINPNFHKTVNASTYSSNKPTVKNYDFFGKFVPVFNNENKKEINQSPITNKNFSKNPPESNSYINLEINNSGNTNSKFDHNEFDNSSNYYPNLDLENSTSKINYSPKINYSYNDNSLNSIIERANRPKLSDLNPVSVTWGQRDKTLNLDVKKAIYKENKQLNASNNNASNILEKKENLIDNFTVKMINIVSNIADSQKDIEKKLKKFDKLDNQEKNQLISELFDSSKELKTTISTLKNKTDEYFNSLSESQKRLNNTLEEMLPLSLKNVKSASLGLPITRTYSGRKDSNALLFDNILIKNIKKNKSLKYKVKAIENNLKIVNNYSVNN